MPIIEGADMASVETERKPFPEDSYKGLIYATEMTDDKKQIVIKHKEFVRSEDGSSVEGSGNEFWDYINVRNNDGQINKYGMADVKRYLEAVFGKGSPESLNADTDPLVGHVVGHYLKVEDYPKKGENRDDKSTWTGKKNVSKKKFSV
jgi:hypothetical protein